jgi:acyl-CoA reductase-like NAD-dependent aldehyde dehydrogenase
MELNHTISAMRIAQRSWAELPIATRAAHLLQVRRRLVERAEELSAVVQRETKKSAADAWFADVVPNLDLFTWWAGPGAKVITRERSRLSALRYPAKEGELYYEPKGIIGLITPWNYPAALPLRAMVPALLAGNAVIFKPSEVTPETGEFVASLFREILPGGLVAVVHGASEAGQAVVDVADHVIFIGGTEAGRAVAARAAERLISASLELGGNDAALVLGDCDLERTVSGVLWGAFTNSGQNCAAIERVYVDHARYESFVSRLVAAAAKLELAPVATDAQDAIVRAHLEDAVSRGAVAHGSYPGPVVLTDVPEDARVLTEETFGPLCPVVSVESAEAGLRAANASELGLTMSIWTRDEARARGLAARAKVGVVTVNNVAMTASMPFAPWSGRGASGGGVTNSPLAILEMVVPKYVLVDHGKEPEPWWFPAGADAVAFARRSLAWIASGPLGRLIGVFGLLGAMRARIARQRRLVADPDE